MQVDRSLEGRLLALTLADRLREERVHLTDVDGFTRRRSGCEEGEALRHRDGRERVVARRPMQEHLAQLWRVLARCDQGSVAAVDFHAIAAAGERNGTDVHRRDGAIRQLPAE